MLLLLLLLLLLSTRDRSFGADRGVCCRVSDWQMRSTKEQTASAPGVAHTHADTSARAHTHTPFVPREMRRSRKEEACRPRAPSPASIPSLGCPVPTPPTRCPVIILSDLSSPTPTPLCSSISIPCCWPESDGAGESERKPVGARALLEVVLSRLPEPDCSP